jgi:hypothetical protein
VTADVLLDGKKVAKLDYQATTKGMRRQPAVAFAIPVNTQRLELRGKLFDPQGKPQAFRKTWQVRDIAATTVPLYDRSRPWINRIEKFANVPICVSAPIRQKQSVLARHYSGNWNDG